MVVLLSLAQVTSIALRAPCLVSLQACALWRRQLWRWFALKCAAGTMRRNSSAVQDADDPCECVENRHCCCADGAKQHTSPTQRTQANPLTHKLDVLGVAPVSGTVLRDCFGLTTAVCPDGNFFFPKDTLTTCGWKGGLRVRGCGVWGVVLRFAAAHMLPITLPQLLRLCGRSQHSGQSHMGVRRSQTASSVLEGSLRIL